MKILNKLYLGLLVWGLSSIGLAPSASAHMLETNYALNLDTLELEAILSNGESFDQGKVTVYAPNDPENPWLEATTDEEGKFTFTPDPAIAGNWSIEIGEDSHWDNIIVPVDDTGIEMEAISSLPSSTLNGQEYHPEYHHNGYFVVVGMGLIGGLSTSLILGRKKS